ncbi:MAG: tyrosine-type recombinase/integrase [Flavobacteriaceae bacterium]|jgi:integrase/recombinase XerD|nr:tyrosine-type recombinase/integrase [Flavobacteriaceae bacterium]
MITLHDAITDFLFHCQFDKNLSSKTLKAYKIDLCQLQLFLINNNYDLEITSITKIELRGYIASISHLKSKSVKRKIATVKALFNYLEFEDILLINPFRKMRITFKEEKKLPAILDIKEILKIFSAAYKLKEDQSNLKSEYGYFKSVRDIAILELLFTTGARVSELANLTKESINLDTGYITIKGKGNKERGIQICNKETLSILKQYRNICKDFDTDSANYFFINRLKKKISDQSIRGVVKNLKTKAGIGKHVTPHMFRHSFATLLLEKDVDIKYIQSLLGHSSIMTTQIYTHVNREKQRQILETKHPRKDFSMFHKVYSNKG